MLGFSFKATLAVLLVHVVAFPSWATSFKLQTSTVILEANKQEVSFNITNTGQSPILLLTTLDDLDGDDAFADKVMINPPVTRLNAGSTQFVKFTLRPGTVVDREHLLKVGFEGVGQRRENNVSIPVRQEIGFIVTPSNLVPSDDPWNDLTLSREADTLVIHNPSRQVVRLVPQMKLVKTGQMVRLSHPYIRPGERLTIPNIPLEAEQDGVILSPMSRFGYKLKDVTVGDKS